ncbi:methyl-accepting chemotaxis protein [Vibrio profundum]|uniref:methyl-accepting chemotaxis protein n=1 Tax=Vibrio profundum TaxID=2910247 RepID=UPI003D0CF98A
MDRLSLSQKQKITLFLCFLSLGFALLGAFTSARLSDMEQQYSSSSWVTSGSIEMYQTEIKLLSLAKEIVSLTSQQVDHVKTDIVKITEEVANNAQFLQQVGLQAEASALVDSTAHFQQALLPWLELRAELGFTVDDGKLGQLKLLANTIEKKIAETGMVTLNSDFQAMIKAQQQYLLQPSEKSLKMFNRAMFGFINMSNTYAMLDLYEDEMEQFKQTFTRVSELSQQLEGREQELFASEEQATRVVKEATVKLSEIDSHYLEQAQSSAAQAKWSVLIACLVLALFAIAILIRFGVSLNQALQRTGAVLLKLSQGDLSQRMSLTNNDKDEFNQLAKTINRSCENLGGLVSTVQSNSGELSSNAETLNVGLDSLAGNMSDMLDQTQLLASATEQVSVTTQEVSGSLSAVAEISNTTVQASDDGGRIITAAIGSLEEIATILTSATAHTQQLEEASQKIDSVMEIITGIAEQTNLLALNAAIEAARAGDQGRGFAVVADEVRNLAVRTVEAVSEISDTIETMKKESSEVITYISQSETAVRTGQEQGRKAMGALSKITEKAGQASEETELISNSIRELAGTSQSMANNMTSISTAMADLEQNNEQMRVTSQLVDEKSSQLNSDCQRFVI